MNSSTSDLKCKFSSRNWKMVLWRVEKIGEKLGLGRFIGQYRTVFNLHRLDKSDCEKRGRLNHLGMDLPFT